MVVASGPAGASSVASASTRSTGCRAVRLLGGRERHADPQGGPLALAVTTRRSSTSMRPTDRSAQSRFMNRSTLP